MHAFQVPPSYHTLNPESMQTSHTETREDGTATRERAQDTTRNVISSRVAAGPEVTPCMTADDDSASLTTPKHPADSSEISSSFVFPSRSYDVQQISNIKEVIPEWEDDEVDEIIVLSDKLRELDSIDEDQELSESELGTSIHAFEPIQLLSTSLISPSPTTSNVALFKHTPSASLYAVKTFTKSFISYDTPTLEHAMKEQMILRLLTQMEIPFILKLRWSFQDAESMRLVTEFCPGGDVLTRVIQSGALKSSLAWLYAAELAEALSALHASGICHRSLHPEHILIGTDGHIILTGFSRASVTAFNSPQSEHKAAIEEKERLQRTANVWSAPEVILGWSHDFAIDCWGFGLLVYFMLTGRHPLIPEFKVLAGAYIHPRVMETAVLYGSLRMRGCGDDLDVVDLITKCVERNPCMRFSVDDIKDHAYFADVNWTRLRDKGYPAPTPAYNMAEQDFDPNSSTLDSLGIQESETLKGVHIAGFNYVYNPDAKSADMDVIGEDSLYNTGSNSAARLSPSLGSGSRTLEDLSVKAAIVPVESAYATPLDSVNSSKVGSAATSSTALYSCTSFGELRDALKARPSEKFPLPASTSGDSNINRIDLATLDVPQANIPSRPHSALDGQGGLSRPTSILLRRDSELALNSRPSSGLGARGLGLRKYASLNFDLDTVVSLEPELERSRQELKKSGLLKPRADGGSSKRRVSFVEALATTSPADVLSPGSTAVASPWRHLTKYYSPNPNVNKLRKRRTESTPILSASPRADQADLPDGVQQIGLGIGYTPAGEKSKVARPNGAPRRSLSLGTGVAKCSALLNQIRRGKAGSPTPETARASEESDAMDAVMREMYGAAWNADAGVGYLSGGGGYGQAASSRRHAGRVYTVDGGADEMGSTLRLVQTPSTVVESPFK